MFSFSRVSRPSATDVHQNPLVHNATFPLCGLCAMLSPIRVFLAHQPPMSTESLSPMMPIPLCDLRDLCAILSPIRVSRPEAALST
jgi:hypothetical protein